MKDIDRIKVLFVCMGNICRSPTAHGVFQSKVDAHGLGPKILVDSAGTHSYILAVRPTCVHRLLLRPGALTLGS